MMPVEHMQVTIKLGSLRKRVWMLYCNGKRRASRFRWQAITEPWMMDGMYERTIETCVLHVKGARIEPWTAVGAF